MAEFNITDTVDITDVVCPVTFVKAKIALEELDDGDILSIKLNDGEPVQNVPRSIKEEGHKVLKLTDNGDGTYELIVRKVGD
ncbi:MAG: sulfurtransferase TusA family protein [Ruminococcus sp.]|nr:sulfurtransferase TusA family protein [Ruminococcus sp.]